MLKNVSNESEIKLKTIFELFFCDYELSTVLKLEKCLKALFNNINISIDLVFKTFFGSKNKYIEYQRLYQLYLKSKDSNNKCIEIKKFFDILLNYMLKEENTFIGNDLPNNYIFCTKLSSKNRKYISMVQVLSDKKGKIHGLIIEYDGVYKCEMYSKIITDKLGISLEIKLGYLNEELIKKNMKEKSQFDEEDFHDAISNIFGTINNKTGYITFLGFKCISGKISFVGFPEGEGFLFGKLGKKFHNLKINMTHNGINKLEPEFKIIPKNNFYLKKLLEKFQDQNRKLSIDGIIEYDQKLEVNNNIDINNNRIITQGMYDNNNKLKDGLIEQFPKKRIIKLIKYRKNLKNKYLSLNKQFMNNNNLTKSPSKLYYQNTDNNKNLTQSSSKIYNQNKDNNKHFINSSSKLYYLITNNNTNLTKSSSRLKYINISNNGELSKSWSKSNLLYQNNRKEFIKPLNKKIYYMNKNSEDRKQFNNFYYLNTDYKNKNLNQHRRKLNSFNLNDVKQSPNKLLYLNRDNKWELRKLSSEINSLHFNSAEKHKSCSEFNYLNTNDNNRKLRKLSGILNYLNINRYKELTKKIKNRSYSNTNNNKELTTSLNSPNNNKELTKSYSKLNNINLINNKELSKSLKKPNYFKLSKNNELIKLSSILKYFKINNNKDLTKPSIKSKYLENNKNKELMQSINRIIIPNKNNEGMKSSSNLYNFNKNNNGNITNSSSSLKYINIDNKEDLKKSSNSLKYINIANNNGNLKKNWTELNSLNNKYNEVKEIPSKLIYINDMKRKLSNSLSNINCLNSNNIIEGKKSSNEIYYLNTDHKRELKKSSSNFNSFNKNNNNEGKKSLIRLNRCNIDNSNKLIQSSDILYLNTDNNKNLKNSSNRLNYINTSSNEELTKSLNRLNQLNSNEYKKFKNSSSSINYFNTSNKSNNYSTKNSLQLTPGNSSEIANRIINNPIKNVSKFSNKSTIIEDKSTFLHNSKNTPNKLNYSKNINTTPTTNNTTPKKKNATQKKINTTPTKKNIVSKKKEKINLSAIINHQTGSNKFIYSNNYQKLKEKLGKLIHDEFMEKNKNKEAIIQQTILNNYIPFPGSYKKIMVQDKDKNKNKNKKVIQPKKQRIIKMKNIKGNIVILEDDKNAKIQNKEKIEENLILERLENEKNTKISSDAEKFWNKLVLNELDVNPKKQKDTKYKYSQLRRNSSLCINQYNDIYEEQRKNILDFNSCFESKSLKNPVEKWQYFRKGIEKINGVYLFQIIGSVLKTMYVLEKNIDIPFLEKIKLYKIIEENESIIKFLTHEKSNNKKKLDNNINQTKNINYKINEKLNKDRKENENNIKKESTEEILSLGSIFTRKVSTKIYLNQKMAQPFEPWDDKIFPPEKKSLCPFNKKGWIYPKNVEKYDLYNWENIQWCPVEEIENMKHFNVFTDVVSVDEIKQGDIGDCYFFSAVGALCEIPYFFNKLFHIKLKTQEHIYGVYFFLNGEWRLVLIDDYFPCIIENNIKKFAFSCSFKKEIWVSLLEKAWAKVNGCYAMVGCGGFCYEAFDVLTEAYTEHIYIIKDKKEELWKKMESSLKKKYPMTAGTPDDNQIFLLDSTGLQYGHAYTIINIYSVEIKPGEIERLVKLKNPWGNTEFNGDWSDKSKKWTPELKKICDFPGEYDDGIFYMSFNDFIEYFIILDIAKLEPGYKTTFCHINKKEATKIQIIKFTIKEKSPKTFIQLYQKNPRIRRKNGTYYPDPVMSFILLAKIENGHMKYINSMTSIPSLSNNQYRMHIAIEENLKPGTYFIFCDVNYRYFYIDYKSYGYTVTFYSKKPITNFENITNSIDRRLALNLVMFDYCKYNIKPIKHKTGLEIYQTENFDIRLPFKVLCFVNPTADLLKIKLDIKNKGEKLFCIYNDNIASEFDTSVIKEIRPKNQQTVLIMGYSILSRYNVSYEILLPDDMRTYENDHHVFQSQKEPIDEEGRLYSYFLKNDEDNGFTIGIENTSNLEFMLKLVLDGLYDIDPEFEGKQSFQFKILSKSKRVFNIRIIPDYKNDIGFFFDLI